MTSQISRLKKLHTAIRSMEDMHTLALARLESEFSRLALDKDDLFSAADRTAPLFSASRPLQRRTLTLDCRMREVERLIRDANQKILRARALQNSIQGKLQALKSGREKLDLAETLQDHISHSLRG